MNNQLEWTGERMMDGNHLAKGIVEHLHRYAIANEYIKDKIVLDIASGEGYGSFLLSKKAKQVYGVDISEISVKHASEKYKNTNLSYQIGSVLDIPFPNSMFDVVVSFETLEHLIEQEQMLKEFKRILKPEGMLIISTPETENYKKQDPNNPYHLKELSLNEFSVLLKMFFNNVNIAQQKFLFSSFIYQLQIENRNIKEYSGDFSKIIDNNFLGSHLFNLAIASNSSNFEISTSIFNGNNQFNKFENSYSENQNQAYLNGQKSISNSKAFIIGSFLISPLVWLKNLLK